MAVHRITLAVATLGLFTASINVGAFVPQLRSSSSSLLDHHHFHSVGRQPTITKSTFENNRGCLLRLQQQQRDYYPPKQSATSSDETVSENVVAAAVAGGDDDMVGVTIVDGSIWTAATVIGQQSLLIPLALGLGQWLGTPFRVDIDLSSISFGLLAIVPLGLIAVGLDQFEERFPALNDVTIATQRAVLLFLGGTFRPVFTSVAALGVGLAAGFGEELLFRGVVQTKLVEALQDMFIRTPSIADASTILAVLLSSLAFGALHAVTFMYFILATLGSIYFGYLMVAFDGNLAVPIVCHAFYDVAALVSAHWEIGKMTMAQKMALLEEPTE
jgi:membrane protease YdiL (CAAX protease family)